MIDTEIVATVAILFVACLTRSSFGFGEALVATGFSYERGGCGDAVGVFAVLAGRGLRALLRGSDRHGPGVVEQRGLHPEEHHREQSGQQDDELDRDRAAFVAPPT